jgi:hypothetical protein
MFIENDGKLTDEQEIELLYNAYEERIKVQEYHEQEDRLFEIVDSFFEFEEVDDSDVPF